MLATSSSRGARSSSAASTRSLTMLSNAVVSWISRSNTSRGTASSESHIRSPGSAAIGAKPVGVSRRVT